MTVDEIKQKYCFDSSLLDKFKKMGDLELSRTISKMSGPQYAELKKVAAEIKTRAAALKIDKDDSRVGKMLALYRIKA